ncbi:hypothetical protein TWF281_011037 [Arthrobotrys megalospora]
MSGKAKAVRRQSATRISAWEWHIVRDAFTELYIGQNKPLHICMELMESQHGFVATRRQYLGKIREWDIDKNVKGSEMKVVTRKVLERWVYEGKDTTIEIRGTVVSRDQLKRFLRREALKASSASGSPGSSPDQETRDNHDTEAVPMESQTITVESQTIAVSLAVSCSWQSRTPVGMLIYTPAPGTRGLHTPAIHHDELASAFRPPPLPGFKETSVSAGISKDPEAKTITFRSSLTNSNRLVKLIPSGGASEDRVLLCRKPAAKKRDESETLEASAPWEPLSDYLIRQYYECTNALQVSELDQEILLLEREHCFNALELVAMMSQGSLEGFNHKHAAVVKHEEGAENSHGKGSHTQSKSKCAQCGKNTRVYHEKRANTYNLLPIVPTGVSKLSLETLHKIYRQHFVVAESTAGSTQFFDPHHSFGAIMSRVFPHKAHPKTPELYCRDSEAYFDGEGAVLDQGLTVTLDRSVYNELGSPDDTDTKVPSTLQRSPVALQELSEMLAPSSEMPVIMEEAPLLTLDAENMTEFEFDFEEYMAWLEAVS